MVTPAIAPYVPSYASRKSYITVDDFLAAPTGTDTTQLLPGQGVDANKVALAGVIERASSVANTFCRKVLAATTDIQSGIYRMYRDGTIRVPVDNTPIVMVTGVSFGWAPQSLSALTDLSGLWISEKVVQVPIMTAPVAVAPQVMLRSYSQVYSVLTYVNGWFHSNLPAATLVGATSVSPADVLGLVAGMPFTVYDGANTEIAQVASSYVVGATSVPLVSPLTRAHPAGVTASALPPDIRQATISLTSALIKRRGGEAIVLQAMRGQPQRKTLGEPGIGSDEQMAARLLKPYARFM